MAIRERKNLSVSIGTYTKDGQEKNRWFNIGELIETDDKGSFIELNPYVNFTALPRKDGRLIVSLFSQEKKDAAPKPAQAAAAAPTSDEIPF